MKFRNIIILVVLLSSSFTQFVFGQFEGVRIIPENPTSDDNIKVEYPATFSYSDCSLGDYSISLQGNEVIAILKYNVGAAAAFCSRVDTLTIGHLNKGNYLLITNTTDSRAYPYDVDTLHFTVGSVDVHEIPESQIIELYPNPTNKSLNINVNEIGDLQTIKIYDISGRLVLSKDLDNVNEKYIELDISSLVNGLYTCTLTGKRNPISKKFIKR